MAETLIALVVTGVVAAIMIPALSALIQTRVREHQVAVAQRKFNKAAEIMMLNGKMGPYYSNTNDFVNELQKYLKIVQVCKVGNSPSNLPPITTCFGENYETITINTDGDTINLTDIQTGSDLGINTNDDTNDWTSSNIGILTIDGTRMILSYNSKCPPVQEGVYVGNASYACVGGVADVDGEKKPNTLGKDVYLFGSAKTLGNNCIGKSIGLCLTSPIILNDIVPQYVNYAECVANEETLGYPDLVCNNSMKSDFTYATLAKICGGADKIASADDIAKVLNYIYGTNIDGNSMHSSMSSTFLMSKQVDDTMAAQFAEFGIPDPRDERNYPIGIEIVTGTITNDILDSNVYGTIQGTPTFMIKKHALYQGTSYYVAGMSRFDVSARAYCKL